MIDLSSNRGTKSRPMVNGSISSHRTWPNSSSSMIAWPTAKPQNRAARPLCWPRDLATAQIIARSYAISKTAPSSRVAQRVIRQVTRTTACYGLSAVEYVFLAIVGVLEVAAWRDASADTRVLAPTRSCSSAMAAPRLEARAPTPGEFQTRRWSEPLAGRAAPLRPHRLAGSW